jgi:hypothetical protein
MTLRQKLLKLGSPELVAIFAALICALPADARAEDPKPARQEATDSTSAQPPARFFTINSVSIRFSQSWIAHAVGGKMRFVSFR